MTLRRSYGSKRPSQDDNRKRLAMFYASVNDGIIQALTLNDLEARYTLPRKELELSLILQKQKRGLV